MSIFSGASFASLDGILLSGNFKLRKVFTTRSRPPDTTLQEFVGFKTVEAIPSLYDLPPTIKHITQVFNLDGIMGGSIEWAVDKMENTGVVVGKTISLAFGRKSDRKLADPRGKYKIDVVQLRSTKKPGGKITPIERNIPPIFLENGSPPPETTYLKSHTEVLPAISSKCVMANDGDREAYIAESSANKMVAVKIEASVQKLENEPTENIDQVNLDDDIAAFFTNKKLDQIPDQSNPTFYKETEHKIESIITKAELMYSDLDSFDSDMDGDDWDSISNNNMSRMKNTGVGYNSVEISDIHSSELNISSIELKAETNFEVSETHCVKMLKCISLPELIEKQKLDDGISYKRQASLDGIKSTNLLVGGYLKQDSEIQVKEPFEEISADLIFGPLQIFKDVAPAAEVNDFEDFKMEAWDVSGVYSTVDYIPEREYTYESDDNTEKTRHLLNSRIPLPTIITNKRQFILMNRNEGHFIFDEHGKRINLNISTLIDED